MAVKPIPDGYHSITPYLCIKDAHKALDFYKSAFGAVELMRLCDPTGKVCHAEISIGGSVLMIADEFPEMNFRGPLSLGGSPVMIHVYVPNVDVVVNQAVASGAKIVRPVQDQFYGDRSGTVADPFGHVWGIATHVEDVAPEEITRRFSAMGK